MSFGADLPVHGEIVSRGHDEPCPAQITGLITAVEPAHRLQAAQGRCGHWCNQRHAGASRPQGADFPGRDLAGADDDNRLAGQFKE